MEVKLLRNGIYSVNFPKCFTLAETPVFTAITMPLEKKDVNSVVLDMKRLELIDSVAIRHLMNFKASMERRGASVKAINASPRIRSICIYKKFDIQFDD